MTFMIITYPLLLGIVTICGSKYLVNKFFDCGYKD